MDLDSTMKRAIKSGNLVELELLLCRTSAPSFTVVEQAVDRLAKKPRSMKRKEAVNLLLTHGWDVNEKLGVSEEPMLSIFVKDLKLVKWLLGKGANPGVISPSGDTSLSFAVTQSSVKIVKLLISANRRYNQNLGAGDLVHRAVRRCGKEENLEILDTLIHAGAPVDDVLWDQSPAYDTKAHFTRGTPLHEACKYGYVDVADMLIVNGANPHKQKTQYRRNAGETPYEIAETKKDTVMLEVMQRHASEPSARCNLGRGTRISVSGSDQG